MTTYITITCQIDNVWERIKNIAVSYNEFQTYKTDTVITVLTLYNLTYNRLTRVWFYEACLIFFNET